VAIFFGSFFDAFDGRVARLTRTQSEFGVELDSLADVITFGVAPAILVYKWALAGIGTPGIAICSIYAACGAIRLARFNVLAHAESGTQRYFVGLPIRSQLECWSRWSSLSTTWKPQSRKPWGCGDRGAGPGARVPDGFDHPLPHFQGSGTQSRTIWCSC